ncbi:15029_t:CDS:2 [Cetraspora pellucida]|uniref:15029_t:CDS:1 n=1 Tax=Cetraspora pellucida TaxID=1433469 RepID=A0ACA9K3A6_9GLOM|nr:15029_t:CDS:2 [Cetraspora pellucida]
MNPKYFVFLQFFVFVFFIDIVSSDCSYNTSCVCPVGIEGTLCGGQIGCNPNNIFECVSTGLTCEYGLRSSCMRCGALSCPSVTSINSTPSINSMPSINSTPNIKLNDQKQQIIATIILCIIVLALA